MCDDKYKNINIRTFFEYMAFNFLKQHEQKKHDDGPAVLEYIPNSQHKQVLK